MSDPLQDNIDIVVRRTDLEFDYEDSEGHSHLYPRVGQGPARPATAEDLARDELGFTGPNLHRRVDPQQPPVADDPRNQEALPRSYDLTIQNVHSYRTTHINTHDEESVYNETP